MTVVPLYDAEYERLENELNYEIDSNGDMSYIEDESKQSCTDDKCRDCGRSLYDDTLTKSFKTKLFSNGLCPACLEKRVQAGEYDRHEFLVYCLICEEDKYTYYELLHGTCPEYRTKIEENRLELRYIGNSILVRDMPQEKVDLEIISQMDGGYLKAYLEQQTEMIQNGEL